MEATDLMPLVEQLDENIDELEEILQPLLATPLSTATKKLPVLDKAKLHVLTTYTIESLLFSYLRLNGANAKEHPVFKELTRVKQYFEKIQAAETTPSKRENLSLNKQAAGRFIKHALTGNDKYDLERAERQAKEKVQAQMKLEQLSGNTHATPQKRELVDDASSSDSNDEDATSELSSKATNEGGQASKSKSARRKASLKERRKLKREIKKRKMDAMASTSANPTAS